MSITPEKALHIDSKYPDCYDPAIKLSYSTEIPMLFWGHLALITPHNSDPLDYSSISDAGDLILSVSRSAEEYTSDLILTNRDVDGSILFATTREPDIDKDSLRMIITSIGRVGINTPNPKGMLDISFQDWQAHYKFWPKISFNSRIWQPSMRFYMATGNLDYPDNTDCMGPDVEVRTWWIEMANDPPSNVFGKLEFLTMADPKFCYDDEITPVSRVTFLNNGNVGINNTDPKAKLQVTKGAVIFDEELDENGNITENQLTDQEKLDMAFTKGCRFMWIPGKHALRCGRIDHVDYEHAWDYDNCGLSSFAFGHNVSAEGHPSFAFGARVRATGDCSVAIGGTFLNTNGMDGAMMLGDDSMNDGSYARTNNQITMRFQGLGTTNYIPRVEDSLQAHPNQEVMTYAAYRFYTGWCTWNKNQTTGVYMIPGSCGWINKCNRNIKENFEPVDLDQILGYFEKVPINYWNIKGYDKKTKHIGPVSQDFFNGFKLGGIDSLGISTVDIDGVNFAAIKGLIRKIKTINDSLGNVNNRVVRNKEILDSIPCYRDLCNTINDIENTLSDLEERISELESKDINIKDKDKTKSEILSAKGIENIILEQNRPNPFSGISYIDYFIPSDRDIEASIIITSYNEQQLIKKYLASTNKPSRIEINASEFNSGVYFYSIQINNEIVITKKMMIVK